MFESNISAGATEKKLPGWQTPHAQTVAWSHDGERHAQKCVERYCELANKKVEQLYKVSRPCLDVHQFKQEENESVWELSEVWSRFVLKCLYLARTGRPEILRSVNKLVRSVRKWTQACDKRSARLILHVHHANDYRQDCHVGKEGQHCRLGLFQDSDFAGDIEDSKSTSSGVFCIFGRPSQLDVQETNFCFAQFYRVWGHFSGCWITYGWFTCSWSLGHRDWSFTLNQRQYSTKNILVTRKLEQFLIPKPTPKHVTRKQKVDQLSEVDHVPTNTHSSQGESQLYIIDDNEAVIKIIITELFWIGCLTESTWNPRSKSNVWTPKTNSLTFWPKEVSREWNHLLCSFNIMSFPTCSGSHFRERTVSGAMSKRGQETNSEEGSPMAKARPTNLVMHSQCKEEVSSQSSESLVNPGEWRRKKKSWLSLRKLVDNPTQTSKLDIPKWIDKRRLHQPTGNLGRKTKPEQKVMKTSSSTKETCCIITRIWRTWNSRIIDAWRKIFQWLHKKLGRSAVDETFSIEAYETNVLTWWMFMASSMKAAIHLGPDFLMNSESYKNTRLENIENVFNIT